MNRSSGKLIFLLAALFIGNTSRADKLEDGFERLKIYDFFNAKEYFEKSLEKKTPGAAYGLSKIFSSDNNPFFNLDSARRYILLSDSAYKTIKTKEKKYYSGFGVNDTTIGELSAHICEKYFSFAAEADTVPVYEHYLDYFGTCAGVEKVIELRNKAAFRNASHINTSLAYQEFTLKYPGAKEGTRASELYQQRLFEEKTVDNKISSYEKFMTDYSDSPYKDEADRKIYRLSTTRNRVEEYAAFARKYPNSKYAGDSWRQVYALSMKDFTEASLNSFKANYPDYPFVSELETDYKLQNYIFLPFEKDEKWGYINEEGTELIAPQYDEASVFSEGLAVVTLNNKSGYINKAGKTILQLTFAEAEAFQNGYAIVLVDSLYGMINRKGEFVIKPQYDELSEVVEDVCIGVKNGKAGYIAKNGRPITECMFDIANDYRDGLAIVAMNDKYGMINLLGKFVIEPVYDELIAIGKNRLKASNNDHWGIVDLHGNTIAEFIYDDIGEYHDGLVLASIDGKYGYLNEAGVQKIPVKYLFNSKLLATGNFTNGFVLLRTKYKTLLADTSGAVINFPGIEQYGLPGEGFVPVMKNKKWGYADMTGKMKILPKYDFVESFKDGLALVKVKGFFGLIDTAGTMVIQPIYDNVISHGNFVVVVKDGKFGALTNNANLILPCAYRSIDAIGGKILRGVNENRLIYVDLNGRIIYVGERD